VGSELIAERQAAPSTESDGSASSHRDLLSVIGAESVWHLF
jgi:hypothetical protein